MACVRHGMARRTLLVSVLLFAATAVVLVQQYAADVEVVGHVLKPEPVSSPVQVSQLKAPADVAITIFAENLGKPRMLAVARVPEMHVTIRKPASQNSLIRVRAR